jgi:thiol-disulfide isomerase/thioredoxin
MKRLPALLLCLFFINILNAQPTKEPLIIQGKLSNCPEKKLKIFFYDENDKLIIDTIDIDDAGNFYFKTFHIHKPQRTSIQQNRTQLNDLFVAPGYDLTITGDATDTKTLYKTKKITGIGAESNQYRIKMDYFYATRRDSLGWYEMSLEKLLPYIKNLRSVQDSIHRIVFNRKPKQDRHFGFFKKMVKIDNESMALYYLLTHFTMNKYGPEQMTALVKQHTPKMFARGISNDDYMISADYKSWLLTSYLDYNKLLDKYRDSTLANQPDYALNKINETFHGKVKDYYLYKVVQSSINGSNSIERLNAARKRTDPIFNSLINPAYKKNLEILFNEKEQQVMQLQVGKPAPAFSLVSNSGKSYQLADFKGKVIYIDLWASWCGPCRAEMPNFKQLYSKYKDNDQIAFMGIAVFDGEKEWRKALEEEKPDWLQLYDKEGIVASSYVANAIPKYILIDKKGNVVNFDAPGPGNETEIQNLIEQEIKK